MRLIIDADPIVYASGFAVEDHTYILVLDGDNGEHTSLFFDNGKDMQAWKKQNKESETPVEILDQVQMVDWEPVENAYFAAKTQLKAMIHAVAEHWQAPAEKLHVTLLLSGPDNFRKAIGQVREYKGNRKDVRRPHWYQEVRDYLVGKHGAVEVYGREADDEASILATKYREEDEVYVIATIDKDLDQIPGLKYDYLKKVFYEVHPDEAMDLFWAQVLSGDSTDNIPGVPGVGAKTATKMVNQWVAENDGDEEIWQKVVKVYEEGKSHPKCEYAGRSADSVALEMAQLIHLQTYPGQLWSPPGIEDERVEVGLDD